MHPGRDRALAEPDAAHPDAAIGAAGTDGTGPPTGRQHIQSRGRSDRPPQVASSTRPSQSSSSKLHDSTRGSPGNTVVQIAAVGRSATRTDSADRTHALIHVEIAVVVQPGCILSSAPGLVAGSEGAQSPGLAAHRLPASGQPSIVSPLSRSAPTVVTVAVAVGVEI